MNPRVRNRLLEVLGIGWLVGSVLGLLTASACGSARHPAVVVDATIAQLVFAVDDAELKVCQTGVLSVTQCTALNPKIKQALIDVKALTETIQKTPKTVAVPVNLPNLLSALTEVQAILVPSGQVPEVAALSQQVSAALAKVIALLRQFAGA